MVRTDFEGPERFHVIFWVVLYMCNAAPMVGTGLIFPRCPHLRFDGDMVFSYDVSDVKAGHRTKMRYTYSSRLEARNR